MERYVYLFEEPVGLTRFELGGRAMALWR
jgi:hypothetical protein